jgi:hypothetical protein
VRFNRANFGNLAGLRQLSIDHGDDARAILAQHALEDGLLATRRPDLRQLVAGTG